MTPTKEVAPYMTGAAPRRTSIRSTSERSRVASAGLKAPPHGTPSTTRRKASNSRRPQSMGTEDAGPPSPPGEMSTPAASARALRRSRAPLLRRSCAVKTSIEAGTLTTSSGMRVAVTSTCSETAGGGTSAVSSARIRGARSRTKTPREVAVRNVRVDRFTVAALLRVQTPSPGSALRDPSRTPARMSRNALRRGNSVPDSAESRRPSGAGTRGAIVGARRGGHGPGGARSRADLVRELPPDASRVHQRHGPLLPRRDVPEPGLAHAARHHDQLGGRHDGGDDLLRVLERRAQALHAAPRERPDHELPADRGAPLPLLQRLPRAGPDDRGELLSPAHPAVAREPQGRLARQHRDGPGRSEVQDDLRRSGPLPAAQP